MVSAIEMVSKMQELDLHDTWFHEDAATCHTALVTMDLLRREFDEQFNSSTGSVNSPPRSCDFTTLDYFLWAMLKLMPVHFFSILCVFF